LDPRRGTRHPTTDPRDVDGLLAHAAATFVGNHATVMAESRRRRTYDAATMDVIA
jgi:hypothetical protein